MEDLAFRLERATVNVGRLLAKRKEPSNESAIDMSTGIFQYLNSEDREVFAKNMVEQYLEKKKLELQRERFADILEWCKALVDLGVELDVRTKNEIRSVVSRLTRQGQGLGEVPTSYIKSSPRPIPKWLNGLPR